MAYQRPWHTYSKDEAPIQGLKWAQAAITDNRQRLAVAVQYASLFEGSLLTSFLPVGYALQTSNIFPGVNMPLLRRKARAIVKGAHAQLWGQDDPLPQWISVGGDWNTQIQATLLNRAIDAEYEQPQGKFDNEHDLWRHAGLLEMAATGSVAVFELSGFGKTEARINDTLSMALETSGPQGAILGCVATDYYEPEELCLRFPNQREAIERNAETMWSLAVDRGMGHVRKPRMESRWVVQVHYLYRCSVRGQDGRKLWILKDATRLGKDEVYEYEELPCTIHHFERQLNGDWGTPLTAYVHEVLRRQNEMAHDLDQKQLNSPQRIVQGPKKTLDKAGGKTRGTMIVESDMVQSDLRITELNTKDSAAMDLVRLYGEWADEDAMVDPRHQGGAGKMATSGKHEKYNASYLTEAFAPESRRIIHARTVQTGKRKARALKDMVKDGQDITRRWEKGSLSEVIDVGDLDLEENQFMLRVASVSEEKNSISSLLDFGQEMVEQEKASLGELQAWRQHLDADSIGDDVTEIGNWLERQMEKWLHAKDSERLEDDFYQSPRKWMQPLARWAKKVQVRMVRAESMGCPPERLEYFELFLEEIGVLIDQEQMQANTSISATADLSQIYPGAAGASPGAGAIGTGPGPSSSPGGGPAGSLPSLGPGGPPGGAPALAAAG
jgi:hypothetical protein